jgi:hypothetical protein
MLNKMKNLLKLIREYFASWTWRGEAGCTGITGCFGYTGRYYNESNNDIK